MPGIPDPFLPEDLQKRPSFLSKKSRNLFLALFVLCVAVILFIFLPPFLPRFTKAMNSLNFLEEKIEEERVLLENILDTIPELEPFGRLYLYRDPDQKKRIQENLLKIKANATQVKLLERRFFQLPRWLQNIERGQKCRKGLTVQSNMLAISQATLQGIIDYHSHHFEEASAAFNELDTYVSALLPIDGQSNIGFDRQRDILCTAYLTKGLILRLNTVMEGKQGGREQMKEAARQLVLALSIVLETENPLLESFKRVDDSLKILKLKLIPDNISEVQHKHHLALVSSAIGFLLNQWGGKDYEALKWHEKAYRIDPQEPAFIAALAYGHMRKFLAPGLNKNNDKHFDESLRLFNHALFHINKHMIHRIVISNKAQLYLEKGEREYRQNKPGYKKWYQEAKSILDPLVKKEKACFEFKKEYGFIENDPDYETMVYLFYAIALSHLEDDQKTRALAKHFMTLASRANHARGNIPAFRTHIQSFLKDESKWPYELAPLDSKFSPRDFQCPASSLEIPVRCVSAVNELFPNCFLFCFQIN